MTTRHRIRPGMSQKTSRSCSLRPSASTTRARMNAGTSLWTWRARDATGLHHRRTHPPSPRRYRRCWHHGRRRYRYPRTPRPDPRHAEGLADGQRARTHLPGPGPVGRRRRGPGVHPARGTVEERVRRIVPLTPARRVLEHQHVRELAAVPASKSKTGTANTTTSDGTPASGTRPPPNTHDTAPAPHPTDSQSAGPRTGGKPRQVVALRRPATE